MPAPEPADRLEAACLQAGQFRRGETVLVGVSGGLDSMVLLHLLARLAESQGWRLTVAHFNHQLRGRNSDADERFVRRAAEKLGLRCRVGHADVRRYAVRHQLSLEMAARKLRHDFLARSARCVKSRTLALAHHGDDQVELFFLRVLRGAGGEGLAGMKPRGPSPSDARLAIVRPLLDQPKSALREYARRHRIRFREDASNASLEFLRNRVRHDLLPWLARRFGPALWKTVPRLMDIVGAESECVRRAARQWLARAPSDQPAAFPDLPVALQRQVLQLQLRKHRVTPEFELVEALRRKAGCALSGETGLQVWRTPEGQVEVRRPPRQSAKAGRFDPGSTRLDLVGQGGTVNFARAAFRWRFERKGGRALRKAAAGCEYFDADKVGSRVVLRHWRPGDRFQPIGLAAAVKLQDLFTNLKVPRERRTRLVVAEAAGGGVFWVEGVRIGERFKLDNRTVRRLKWCWTRPAAQSLRPGEAGATLRAKSKKHGRRE